MRIAQRRKDLFGAQVAAQKIELKRMRLIRLRTDAGAPAVQIKFEVPALADQFAVGRKGFARQRLDGQHDCAN